MLRPLALIALAIVSFRGHPAYSCSCVDVGPPGLSTAQKIIAEARATTFVAVVEIMSTREVVEIINAEGRFVGLLDASGPLPPPNKFPRSHYLVATFKPVHVWKGAKNKITEVVTGLGMSDCGLPFSSGQMVLLYANADDYTGLLSADSCGRTNLYKDATQDAEVLSKRYRNPAPSSIAM